MSVKTKFLKYLIYVILGCFLLVLVVRAINTIRIRTSTEYKIAQQYILKSEEVNNTLGNVKQFEKFPHGKLSYENGDQYAQIEVDVIGTKDEGLVVLLMHNKEGNWELEQLVIKRDD